MRQCILVHSALMRTKGQLTEDAVMGAARSIGVDVGLMRADMADPVIEESTREKLSWLA